MDSNVVTGLFTLAGTLLGAIGTYAVTVRTARMENQRHLRELGLKLALTNFDFFTKQAQAEANMTRQSIPVLPLSLFAAEGIKLAEILTNQRLTPDEIGKAIADLKFFRSTVAKGIFSTPQ